MFVYFDWHICYNSSLIIFENVALKVLNALDNVLSEEDIGKWSLRYKIGHQRAIVSIRNSRCWTETNYESLMMQNQCVFSTR